MIGIYKITSPSGKVYVGQSVNIKKRFNSYKNNDCKNQIILYRSFLKYGVENHTFEIIDECNINELNDKERFYQDLYNSMSNKGLNCKLTKTKDKTGVLSEATKTKISNSNKGKKVSEKDRLRLVTMNIGKKLSEETKLKISLGNKGRQSAMLNKKMSDETKLKMSQNSAKYWFGKNRSLETKKKISNKLTGKVNSVEARKKMSENSPKYWKNKTFNKEHKEKLSLAKIGKESNSCKIIIDISNGIFYKSIKEASKIYNIKQSTLAMQLLGYNKNKTNLRYA